MPLAGNVIQMLVVRAEQKAVCGQALLQQALHNGRQVFGRAALAHQNGQPGGQLLLRLGKGGALVLCLDAGSRVCRQGLAAEPRRMPVDMLVLKQRQLIVNFACAGHHVCIAHHLAQPRHTRAHLCERRHVLRRKGRAVRLERRGGHAGGNHPVNIHRQGLACL